MDELEKVADLVELEASRDVARAVDVLRDARARRGANGAEIAKRARVSVQTVSNMNVGKGTVSLETLARCARALGLRVALIPAPVGLLDESAGLEALDALALERAAVAEREAARAAALASSAGEPWPWAEAGAPAPSGEV